MSTNDKKTNKSEKIQIKPLIDLKSTEIKIVNPKLLIFSKRREEYDIAGNLIPIGTRYTILQKPSKRKILFDNSEIEDLIHVIEKGNAFGKFSIELLDEEFVSIQYLNRKFLSKLTVEQKLLDFIVLALHELEESCKNIDKK